MSGFLYPRTRYGSVSTLPVTLFCSQSSENVAREIPLKLTLCYVIFLIALV